MGCSMKNKFAYLLLRQLGKYGRHVSIVTKSYPACTIVIAFQEWISQSEIYITRNFATSLTAGEFKY
jgi:hypothetical protein